MLAFTGGAAQARAANQSSPGPTFDVKPNFRLNATSAPNVEAAIINGWFIANTMHDITYRYGFTENAGNFQANNFGKGGKEGDPVLLSIQDPGGVNNGFFQTPPEYVITVSI